MGELERSPSRGNCTHGDACDTLRKGLDRQVARGHAFIVDLEGTGEPNSLVGCPPKSTMSPPGRMEPKREPKSVPRPMQPGPCSP